MPVSVGDLEGLAIKAIFEDGSNYRGLFVRKDAPEEGWRLVENPNPIPIPAAAPLMLAGLGVLGLRRRGKAA